ncbi:hypothetical protein ASPVEDRAFT_23824 [Aspergillus versicolor CBS 583.65]|uniref:Uncharacterized protein n=1 Tax=Aspergillus versicolor CBS 583.65 TaxID=1036611 RepID=A0A1L9P5M8_ASPVE|nr:uncharacterized protein ASPVEDRAFT_23824 [Aspergillus versicolor CBS 583.65]OJI96841.1 hypothetical protein ASPVEDRAFT_23824 [Aspergillus versicolor CBS 583.65]
MSESNVKSKIENTKSNLPLPEQPPTASDWNSADQRAVNVGSGGVEGPISGDQDTALRGPATASSSAREVGSETHRLTEPTDQVGRGDFPKDARARETSAISPGCTQMPVFLTWN